MAKSPSRKSASPRPSREGSGKTSLKSALEKHKASLEKKKQTRASASKKKAAPPKDPFARFKKEKPAPRTAETSSAPEGRHPRKEDKGPSGRVPPTRAGASRSEAPQKEKKGPSGRVPPTRAGASRSEAPQKEKKGPSGRVPPTRGIAPRGTSPRNAEGIQGPKGRLPSPRGTAPHDFPPLPPSGGKGAEPALDEMRLNKFLAHAGIASRRAADTLILQGHVTVNGKVVQEMGYKVQPSDKVEFRGKLIRPVDKLVYYLLNKPRNVMSTASDERGRKTVLDILARKVKERVYPVGRLDRNTSGLILLTNDGDLTKKLSHPSHNVPKVYHVTLDKPLTQKDMDAIRNGITLEDGVIKADSIHPMEDMSKRDVQIELHSGKNRIVRRIFEHLGYEVVKLDRTYYAGLTKKNLPRGFFRPLTAEEIRMLKHFV